MNPAVYYLSSLETNIPYVPTEIPIPNGQIWDQYNLNTSVYSDGTRMPKVDAGWTSLSTGAWRYYDNDSTNAVLFGRLYNWYAVNGVYDAASLADPNLRKDIAPEGWRVATFDDWVALITYYGGNSVAAGKLKEPGTTYWQPTNSTLTPDSQFNARGGGAASGTAITFSGKYTVGYWWPFNSDKNILMAYNTTAITGTLASVNLTRGSSVRLIKKDIIIPGFTTTLSSYDANSIVTGGDIPVTYTETISERGIVWGTSPLPNIIGQAPNKIPNGSGVGSYPVTINGLTPVTTYYIRAYAIITTGTTPGTAYADQQIVTTQSTSVTVTTSPTITSIGASSATGGGNITYIDPEYPVTVSGLVWSTSINPTVALATKTTDGPTGTTTGSFTSNMTGLSATTHYYVRAYATNSLSDTSYGDNVEFDTIAGDILKYAYSVRRVVPGYTGPGIQVRKGTSTTLLQDFFFDAITGELNQAAILSFVGPTDIGYVTKWYDQSGNGNTLGVRDVVPGREPRIVASNAIYTKNGRPAVLFLASGLNILRSAIVTAFADNNLSMFAVYAPTTTASTMNVMGIGSSIFPRPNVDGFDYARYAGSNRIQLGPVSTTNKIYSNLTTPTGISAWKNNISLGSEVSATSASTATGIFLGYQSVGGVFSGLNGSIQEILIYTGDTVSRTSITSNAMTYYSIT